MYYNDEQLPIGALLQAAGLVSEQQINIALNTQSKYNKMRLGEILVLQTGIKEKTINFFVDKWRKIKFTGKQFPLGYYLKKAALLDEEQIKIVLKEQKQSEQKFGTIVVQKGWLSQATIDFFLDNLPAVPPHPVSLSLLERYSDKTLHLEKQAANPTLVLQEIIQWTGGNPILTKTLCQILANSDSAIPLGLEKTAVRNLVSNALIKDWRNKKTAEYIRNVANSILHNPRCKPTALLQEYRRMILQGKVAKNNTQEQQELLIAGLAIAQKGELKIANPIYQRVFNLNWIEAELDKIKQSSRGRKSDFSLAQIEPITKLSSLLILSGIAVIAPLIIILNNYNSKSQDNWSTSQALSTDELNKLCQNSMSVELNFKIVLIRQLEREQRRLQADFPADCESMLHQLWVLAAPQLGKEGRVIEAMNYLCKVPPTSESFNQAKLWIDHWYNSPVWGQKTQSYVNLISNCPAAQIKT